MSSLRHTPGLVKSLDSASPTDRVDAGFEDAAPAVDLESVDLDPVLRSARQVIMTHGPRRATLTEIARQAGVSRMTVYRRFESLDRLVSMLLTEELGQVLAQVPSVRAPESDPSTSAYDRAVELVIAVMEGIADHPMIRRVLAVDPEAMVPLMTSRFGQTQRHALTLLVPLLESGMASRGGDGTIRDTDPHGMGLALITAAQGFIFAAQALDQHAAGQSARAQWPIIVASYLQPEGPS